MICDRLEALDGRPGGRAAGAGSGPRKAREIPARYDPPQYERIHADGGSREDGPRPAPARERPYAGREIE